MLKKFMVAAVMAVGAMTFVPGCGAVGGGESVVKYQRGGVAQTIKATKAGEYKLYKIGEANPLLTANLKVGDEIGFKQEGEKLFAIYGTERFETETGWAKRELYWKLYEAAK
jgi:hypothetical protein